MGERSPINDTDARGTFTGVMMNTSRADMVQAVMEGVAFAIRDSFEIAKSLGVDIARSTICGGGSNSALWCKMIANILGISLNKLEMEQGPDYGACILAMVGCEEYTSVSDAVKQMVHIDSVIEPDPVLTARYEQRYQIFQKIYPSMKSLFQEMHTE